MSRAQAGSRVGGRRAGLRVFSLRLNLCTDRAGLQIAGGHALARTQSCVPMYDDMAHHTAQATACFRWQPCDPCVSVMAIPTSLRCESPPPPSAVQDAAHCYGAGDEIAKGDQRGRVCSATSMASQHVCVSPLRLDLRGTAAEDACMCCRSLASTPCCLQCVGKGHLHSAGCET